MACAFVPAGVLAAPSSQVRTLRQEVAALQLDHALNLTRQQAQALLPLIQEAKGKVEAFRSQLAASEPARVAALGQAVADLKATGAVADSTVQALQAARPGAAGSLRQDLRSFWQEARQVLRADQLQALKTARLGVGQPSSDTETSSARPGGHRHPARRFLVMRTLLTDDFASLVQARAG